jgi:hypothetical protein
MKGGSCGSCMLQTGGACPCQAKSNPFGFGGSRRTRRKKARMTRSRKQRTRRHRK